MAPLAGPGATAPDGGRWDLPRVLALHEAKPGGAAEAVEESTRRNIFRKELEQRISDGTGDLVRVCLLLRIN